MAVQIDSKIKGFAVVTLREEAPVVESETPKTVVIQMHEGIARPDVLVGATYKLKSPLVEHALYITINDIVLNQGTADEVRRPFEIFINSKSMEHFQWIVALTRIMSAVFRKGGDVAFLIDEMKSVVDPKGGYYKNGKYMNSLVAEVGATLEEHLEAIGYIVKADKGAAARAMMAEKMASHSEAIAIPTEIKAPETGFPPNATVCGKCHEKAVVVMDGCSTCLNCGQSKCG